MSNISSLDYSSIDQPYNDFLERAPDGVDAGVGGEASGGGTQVTSPNEMSANVIDGSSLKDIYIENFIKSINYKPKSQGFYLNSKLGYIEANKLYIGSGGIEGGSIHVPNETDANSFHVDSDGNAWWGANVATGYTGANAYVLNTGEAKFKDVTLDTSVTINDIQSGSEIAIQGWESTLVFTASNYRTVTWSAGNNETIKLMDGTTYTFTAGTTGSMAALTYIYLNIAASTTALQVSTTATDAVGSGKILVAVAQNNSDTISSATFQVFGGKGGTSLLVDNIAANSASTNEFVSNTAQIKNAIIISAKIGNLEVKTANIDNLGVTDAKINTLGVNKLTAGSITSKAITLAVSAGTGDAKIQAGKCFAKGTKILMYDGSVKNVENIKVEDEIMGNDSTPRKVLDLGRGKEEMFKITLRDGGGSFICNKSHILSLKSTTLPNNTHGKISNIPIDDYIKLNKTYKALYKAYKSGVEYKHKKVPIDPYFLGIWLGDGTSKSVNITSADNEIIEFLKEYANSLSLVCKIEDDQRSKAKCIRITNGKQGGNPPTKWSLQKELRKIGVIGNKHIPENYLINSRNVRLQVLAGLMDSDGYKDKGNYEICLKNEQLIFDIRRLALSLGFATGKIRTRITKGNKYFRLSIIAKDFSSLPVKLERKRIIKPIGFDQSLYSFKVESVGMGEYYGFTINKNRLFLLDNFIVCHNTDFGDDTAGFILGIDDSVAGDPAKFEIGNATDYLKWTGTALSIAGTITATLGEIGGWAIGATSLADAAGVVGMSSEVTVGDDIRFWAGHATPASAPFKVTEAGALTASSATITGALTTGVGSSLDGQYLGNLTVATGALANLAVTAGKIDNATITATQIAAATITANEIAALTITAAEIANATITAGKIGNAEITTTQISGTAGITGGQIANATITTSQISNTAGIVGGQIANLTIAAGNITNLTITAAQIANTTITGGKLVNDTITGSKLKIGNQSWSHDIVFSSTDLNTVAWAIGTITMADGSTTYSIVAGNTEVSVSGIDIAFVDGGLGDDQITRTAADFLTAGFEAGDVIVISGAGQAGNNGSFTIISLTADTINVATGSLTAEVAGATVTIVSDMTALTYIYLDIAVSTTVLQTTTIASNAVGDGKILIAVAKNSTTEATFQVYGGAGGVAITGGDIENASIVAGNIATNAIEEAKIAADAVTAAKIAVAGLDGTTGDVAANHIIAGMLQTDCVTSAKIQADAVIAAKINVVGLDGATGRIVVADATDANVVTGGINTHATTLITAGKIVISGATNLSDWRNVTDATKIEGGSIYTNTITATQIAAGTITAAEIGANVITAAEIFAGTITTTEIAANTIVAGNIAAATITGTEIAATTIAAGNIVANTITSSQLTTGAFVTAAANITDGIITNAKINDLAVSKLTAGTINSKSIVLGVTPTVGDVEIRAGIATGDFANVGAASGFIIGLDDSDADKPKFYIGDASTYMKWDGTNIAIVAGTGSSVDFSYVAGATKPSDNATVGATFGSNIAGGGTSNEQVGNTGYVTLFQQLLYGDGADGVLSITGAGTTTVLTDIYQSSITIADTRILDPNGFRLHCNGTTTNNSGCKIKRIANNGSAGAGESGGGGASALANGSIYGGLSGGTGGYSAHAGGAVPTKNNAAHALTSTQSTGAGGVGGGGGQAGATGGTSTLAKNYGMSLSSSGLMGYDITPTTVAWIDVKGSSGGGGAGADTTQDSTGGGGGGGGGGNGATIHIFSKILVNNGSIEAIGGNGANGAAGSNCVYAGGACASGGGGGGGGTGGFILTVSSSSSAGTATVTGGTEGSGGAGGTNSGGGANGSVGSAGTAGATGITKHIQF